MRYFFVFLFIFAAYAPAVYGETIELKNGKKIVGDIIRSTEDSLIISKDNGNFIYSIARDRIKSVAASTEKELEAEKKRQFDAYALDKAIKSERDEKLKQYRLERYGQEVAAAKKARGRVKIKFSKDRFGVVDAALNGKVAASLLVDTGASLVVISKKKARELGITNLDELEKIYMSLADGSITSDYVTILDSVRVGNSEVKKVKTVISDNAPGPGIDGLLGMSFLSNFHVKMDAKENCLILEKY